MLVSLVPASKDGHKEAALEVELEDLADEKHNLDDGAHHKNRDVRGVEQPDWKLGSLLADTSALQFKLGSVVLKAKN